MSDEKFDPFEPPQLNWNERLGHTPAVRTQSKEFDPVLAFLALFNLEARDQLLGNGPVEKIYAVPRRFDLATLFVVSTAFAFFCALMTYISFDWFARLSCCVAISLIGTSQAVLYGGRAPRLSSVVSGAVVFIFLSALFTDRDFGPGLVVMAVLFGPFCGYLIGTLVGGVFLIADNIRQNWPESLHV